MSAATNLTHSFSAPRQKFPLWLFYSLLTIVLWGGWAAISKVISDDINAYTNQVLFALGLIPVILVVYRADVHGSRAPMLKA